VVAAGSSLRSCVTGEVQLGDGDDTHLVTCLYGCFGIGGSQGVPEVFLAGVRVTLDK